MVKLKKEDEERRRLFILREIVNKKKIAQIAKEMSCAPITVYRIKKKYEYHLLKVNYNKRNRERLNHNEGEWKREITKKEDIFFHGLSLKSKKRTRKSIIPYKARRFIYKKCKDTGTGNNGMSIEAIKTLVNKKFKKELLKNLSSSTIQRFLKKKFKRVYRIRQRPILTKENIEKRKNFAKSINDNNLDSDSIFFTDEKRFLVSFMPNKQTNKIRLCKKTKQKIKQGDVNAIKKTELEIPRHSQGVMVAGGVCSKGVGKLIFVIGTMDTCAYKQALDYYKQDLINLSEEKELIFQQDNAPCHVSKDSIKKLEEINHLEFWPPNSPDLSPIETVWSIIQSKLEGKIIKNIEELKKEILYIWNRIPQEYCKKICDKFIKDIKIVAKTGHRVRGKNNKKKIRFELNKVGKYSDKIENIVYNQSSLIKIKKIEIKKMENKNKTRNKIINLFKGQKTKPLFEKIKNENRYINSDHINTVINEVKQEYNLKIEKTLEEINELKKTSIQMYFEKMNSEKKNEIIKINIPNMPRDESTIDEDDKRIIEIINKASNKRKKIIKNYINKFISENLNKKKRRRRATKSKKPVLSLEKNE